MTNPCKQEKVIELLLNDLQEIKKDVRSLVKFQSKIIGAIAATFSISTLVGFITGVVLKLYIGK